MIKSFLKRFIPAMHGPAQRAADSKIPGFRYFAFGPWTPPSTFTRSNVSRLLAGILLLLPLMAHAALVYLPSQYFNTFDEAKASCVDKRQWYTANYGFPNQFSCEHTINEGPNAAKWAVWDYIFNSYTVTNLYKAIYPKSPCPDTQNFVAPGECTIPPPNKNNGPCPPDALK